MNNSEFLGSPEQIYDIKPTLILVTGVSAVGKTTLTCYACEALNDIGIHAKRPVAYTTREPRENEVDGVDYKFVKQSELEQCFLQSFTDHPDDWDVDNIGGNWYFNRFSNTAPDESCPISILPVTLESCEEMATKYKKMYPDLNVKIITIMIDESNKSTWIERMLTCRRNRNHEKEIYQNWNYSKPEHFDEEIIVPEWNLDTDKVKFMESVINSLLTKT